MKKLFLLFSILIIVASCGTTKNTTTSTTTGETKKPSKPDTVYIKTFKDLPNTRALLSKYFITNDYFPSQGYNHRVKYIILHYTASDDETSAMILTKKEVSSHYLIQTYEDKKIQLLVPEYERAWHAGVSYWRGKENLNDTSIGIEIVNPGYTGNAENMVFTDFYPSQIDKVVELVKDLISRYQIEPYNVIAHSDVAPDRKQDPGPKFPWKMLYEKHHIGAWYNESDKNYFQSIYPDPAGALTYSFIYDTQQSLREYGYNIYPTGTWDTSNMKVVQAFQFHFRPSNYSGVMDAETWAILKALLSKYPSK